MHFLLCEKTVITQKHNKSKQIAKQKQKHTSVRPRQVSEASLYAVKALGPNLFFTIKSFEAYSSSASNSTAFANIQ